MSRFIPLSGAILPEGSWILVTGANGLVGSHVVDQFLKHGYNVRGTVRDSKKHAWLARYFEEQYGTGRFELAVVQDLTDFETLKAALEGKQDDPSEAVLDSATCAAQKKS